MNELTLFILRAYRTRMRAATEMKIGNSCLSVILNGYRQPTRSEREKLRRALGPYYFKKFFAKKRPKAVEQIQGEAVVNE